MTIREGIALAAAQLENAGIAEAGREAWLLLGASMGVNRVTLLAHAGDRLSDPDRRAFFTLIERRAKREPVAQILGQKEFWSLPFAVSGHVLCPRPDSETLVEMALALVQERFEGQKKSARILDLGTGSGCLVLALLSELPGASAVGVDRSVEALRIARANGERLGLSTRVDWLCADWGQALAGAFDLVVSNPPYIRADDWPTLAPEIRLFEPDTALIAGKDGLDAYWQIGQQLNRLLTPNGIACFEHGIDQGDAVAAIMARAGLTTIARKNDLAGIERCQAVTRS